MFYYGILDFNSLEFCGYSFRDNSYIMNALLHSLVRIQEWRPSYDLRQNDCVYHACTLFLRLLVCPYPLVFSFPSSGCLRWLLYDVSYSPELWILIWLYDSVFVDPTILSILMLNIGDLFAFEMTATMKFRVCCVGISTESFFVFHLFSFAFKMNWTEGWGFGSLNKFVMI
jgi:hypothetical protein